MDMSDEEKRQELLAYLAELQGAPAAEQLAPTPSPQEPLPTSINQVTGPKYNDAAREELYSRLSQRSPGALIAKGFAGLGDAISSSFGGVQGTSLKGVNEIESERRKQAVEQFDTGRKQTIENFDSDVKLKKASRDEGTFQRTAQQASVNADPASPVSTAKRNLLKKLGYAEDASNLSGTQLDGLLKVQLEKYKADEKHAGTEETRNLRQDATRERLDFRKEQEGEKQVTQYSRQLEGTNIPGAIAVAEEVLNKLPAPGKDVPGYGPIAGAMPQWALSGEGKTMRQSVQRMFNIELKDRSGAAITDTELARLKEEFGQGSWSTEESLRNGIRMYMQRLQEISRNVEAGTAPDARQEYQARGGRNIGQSTSQLVERSKQGTRDQQFEPDVMSYAQRHGISPAQAQQIKLKRQGGQP